MSHEYIPKEKLTAYERWEVAAFDEAERMARAMRDAEAAAPVAVAAVDEVTAPPPTVAPVVDEVALAAIRQQAFDEGRAEGLARGFDEGRAEGLASGEAQAKLESARIGALARNFALSIDASEAGLADAVLQLSLDLAAQVMCTAIQIKPDVIMPVVREAIAALSNPHGHPSLLINPDDAEIVRKHLGEQLSHTGWRIFEDPQIPRGGCRIENGGAEIDATLTTRWRRVIETLGQQTDWLEPR